MSADNGYIIRKKFEKGKPVFVLQMYFASDEKFPSIDNPNAETFTSLLDAVLAYATQEDRGEYGLEIDIDRVQP